MWHKTYIFTSLLTVWGWEKWKLRVIRNSAMKSWRSWIMHLPLLGFNTEAKLLGNTNATCWTAAVAMIQSLPDTKTVQGSLHLPLLPLAPVKASIYRREPEKSTLLLPLVTHLRGQNGDCNIPWFVQRKATVTVSTPCLSLLELKQQPGTSRSRSGARCIQGKGGKSQRCSPHQRFPFPVP